MNARILKFDLSMEDFQIIAIPMGTEPLTVQEQNGKLRLWAKCSTSAEGCGAQYEIRIAGTGHDIEGDGWAYLSTVLLHDGALVLHAFWRFA